MLDLIERLKVWSDSKCTCTQCGQLELVCCCSSGHEIGQNWEPTDESRIFDEASVAIELLHNFALQACPKCDGCGKLLLEGGIVESDGLHSKPARIVCIACVNPDVVNEPSRAELLIQNWQLSEGDAAALLRASAEKLALAKIACEPLKPYVPQL